ncbi:MAG: FHIPEP family type III secretion protein, partial [Phycisphaerales bacterium]
MASLPDRIASFVAEHRAFALPAALLGMLVVLLVPMGPSAMDALVALNFALAALILVRASSLRAPLEFSAFPALLLGTTLFRLVINVASTRLILGAQGSTPEEVKGVAGRLIESFGRMVAGDSVVVGATVFAILVVVQFVVITKGASRMAEVAARFALDALPGRQMAIDADLASGAIDARSARRRRAELAREADFFGAMDGASRFVRGDAIAGLVITAVNVVGGMLVGVVQNGWGIAETARAITVLSIGDGLAAQVPAFVIAVAAGLVTARAGRGKSIGEELPRQVVGGPRALWMLSGFMAVLSLTPLPTVPLLVAAAVSAGLAMLVSRAGGGASASFGAGMRAVAIVEAAEPDDASERRRAEDIGALLSIEPLEVEVGADLVELVREGDASP